VEAWDLAAERLLHTFAGAHDRPPHCLRLSADAAGAYAAHAPASYDLFLTAAADGAVTLWDLRAAARARRLAGGHTCRAQPAGAALSPCLRYAACGGDDRAACVYDLRGGTGGGGGGGVLCRLGGHGDAVTDVGFSPRHPVLATGCADGRVRAFADRPA
jgi:WD40 repeat protein